MSDKYECRRCRDTWVVDDGYSISRCDCPRSVENVKRMLRKAAEFFRRLSKEHKSG